MLKFLIEQYTSWGWVMIINWIATIIWICMLIPQFFKTVTTKDTYSISIFMYLFYPISNVIWICYEVFMLTSTHSLDIIGMLANDCIGFCLSITIFSIKFYNFLQAKKLGITELEHFEKYIKNSNKKDIIKSK